MNISAPLSSSPILDSKVMNAADSHKRTVMGFFSFGKVSPVTGWRAVLHGEFFGHGKITNLTGEELVNSITSTHGQAIADKVDRQLGLSLMGNKCINSYKVAKAVALIKAERDWTEPHVTTINYAKVNESGKATSSSTQCKVTLTPLGCLKALAGSSKLFGISSMDVENKNVVNGWVEKMHVDSNETPLTSFVRSGMLMPSSETFDIAKNRYTQILSAMIETTPSLTEGLNVAENSKTNPLPIEHAHIGLLSTNKEKELAMAQLQLRFIQKINESKEPIQIDYLKPGTTDVIKIWIKPTVFYTNFSVQKAQRKSTTTPEKASSPDTITEETLDHYLKPDSIIEKKIIALYSNKGSDDADNLKQSKEWQLLEEVRALRATRSQEGSSFYSYEFQAKYSLLLAKYGIPTHVYCKSGKDRTSRFSEMTKMWAANPDLKLTTMTRDVRNVIKAFSFSGNMTVQRLCTGFSGNKQFKTYWRLIAGEKKDRTFNGWTHAFSVGSYSGWGASTLVKT